MTTVPVDRPKAITYVQTRGDAIEQARLAAIINAEPASAAVLRDIADRQNPDGGFGYWLADTTPCSSFPPRLITRRTT